MDAVLVTTMQSRLGMGRALSPSRGCTASTLHLSKIVPSHALIFMDCAGDDQRFIFFASMLLAFFGVFGRFGAFFSGNRREA
jgi:hypothetical protein